MAANHPAFIGDYAVRGFLGEGGAGRVYACRDERLDRDVAVKVLRPEVAQDKTRRDRFLREGRMMAKVRSLHVAAVYAVGEYKGLPFLAMELLDGQDLESRLREKGPMSVADALSVARQACIGLEAALRIEVIHRDIKPANIVLTAAGAKLTDFGLARTSEASAKVTSEGLVTGTPAFLAPERAMAKGDDEKSDMYSLGATLYALIAGVPPFERETPIEVITAHMKETAIPLEQVMQSTPVKTGRLVRRMMEKDPRDRFDNYGELIEAITECLSDCGEMTSVNDPFAPPSSGVAPARAPTGVHGTLAQMGVSEVVQMLEIGRKTAGIDVEPRGRAKGYVSLEGGKVVHAKYGALEGPEAFYALSTVRDGTFRIRYNRAPEGRNIVVPTQYLLLEAMRRVDDGGGQKVLDPPTAPAPRPISALDDLPSDDSSAEDAPVLLDEVPPYAADGPDPLAPRDTLIVDDAAPDDDDDDLVPTQAGDFDPLGGDTLQQDRPQVAFSSTKPPQTLEAPEEVVDVTAPLPTVMVSDDYGPKPYEPGTSLEDELSGSLGGQTAENPLPDWTADDADPHSTPETVDTGAGRIEIVSSGLTARAIGVDDTHSGSGKTKSGSKGGRSRSKTARGSKTAQGSRTQSGNEFEGNIETELVADRTDTGPAPWEMPDTQPADSAVQRALEQVPWLARLDAIIVGSVKNQPWLLGVIAFPFLVIAVTLLILAFSSSDDRPPLSRIDQGDAQGVLAELEDLEALSGPQELVKAHALIALDRPDEALTAILAAQQSNDADRRSLQWVVDRLENDDVGPEIDLLIEWSGPGVTELLVEETEREDYAARTNAVMVLDERGESDAYDVFEVALKNLRDAPTCPLRRQALRTIKKKARRQGKAAQKRSRQAVAAAAKKAGNDCMAPLFDKMLPKGRRK